MEDLESKSAWICPNDRHLALRAKLRSGWSVRSNQITRQDVPEFSSAEMEKIRDVINKASLLEEMEQERIGCLVQKLNNMRQNSMGDGNATCILCAEQFGKFMGNAPIICKECKKKVCHKCCVDYYTGARPTTGKQQAQNSNCSWLCKICSENRELWKRSGAWFFQALPQYRLPNPSPPPERKRHRYMNTAPALSPLALRKDLVASSPANNKGHQRTMSGGSLNSYQWAKPAKPNFTSSSEELEDSSDDDGITLGKSKKTNSQGTISDTMSFTSSTSVTSFEKQTLSSTSSPGITRQSSSRRKTFRTRKNLPLSDEADGTSVESHATNSPIDDSRLPVDMSNLHGHGGSNGDLSSADGSFLMNCKGDRGSIEFSITYDSSKCAVHVSILRAQDLTAMDSNGLSDPYVKLHLLPGTSRELKHDATKLRTKTKNATLNPVFNETLTYWGILGSELFRRKVLITVLDEDRFGQDFIGEIVAPLSDIKPNEKKSYNLPLNAAYALKEEDKRPTDNGRIHVGLRYSISDHNLVVTIHQCTYLIPRKKEHDSVNAFVKATLSFKNHRSITHKTEVKKKNQNPVFEKEMKFQVSADNGQAELASGKLLIVVTHKDAISHDTIGSVEFGINSAGDKLKQWFSCLKHADEQFDSWHILSSDEPAKKSKGKS